jgi:hypothetical protein
MRLRIIILLVFAMSFTRAHATNSTHMFENWSVGLHFGATSFFGDLADFSGGLKNTPFSKYFYQDMRTMTGVSMKKWFSPYIGVRGYMGYGKLQGTKETSDAYFQANILNYHLAAMLDLTNLIFGVDRRRIVSVSGFIGIGFTESRTWKYSLSTGEQIGSNGFGKPRTPEGNYVPMTETVVPAGIIVNVFVSNKVSFYAEGSFHPINSDKLDATPNANSSGAAGLEGYNYFGVGMNIWFGSRGRSSFRPRGGGPRYSISRGTSINKRFYRRNTRAIFKRGKSRMRFKRSR